MSIVVVSARSFGGAVPCNGGGMSFIAHRHRPHVSEVWQSMECICMGPLMAAVVALTLAVVRHAFIVGAWQKHLCVDVLMLMLATVVIS